MSAARDQEYFCDGIAEEIINALCCVRGLQVASRTSSFQFKGRAADVREIGRSLGVTAVLEGSVRRSAERVRITAQLVSSADGFHLWSESFDRRLEDVFATQSEIARNIVSALRSSLTREEEELIERGGTRNPQAYEYYLRARQLHNEHSDTTIRQAIGLFRRAIESDPQFAKAHAGLAMALGSAIFWRMGVRAGAMDEAMRAAKRAEELAPGSAGGLARAGQPVLGVAAAGGSRPRVREGAAGEPGFVRGAAPLRTPRLQRRADRQVDRAVRARAASRSRRTTRSPRCWRAACASSATSSAP